MAWVNNPSEKTESGKTEKHLTITPERIQLIAKASQTGVKELLLRTPSVEEIFGDDEKKFIEFAELLKKYWIKTINLDEVIENGVIKEVWEE